MARPCFLSLPKQLPTGNQVFKCLDYGRYLTKDNYNELNSFCCVFKTMFSTWALRMFGRDILAFHFKPAPNTRPLWYREVLFASPWKFTHTCAWMDVDWLTWENVATQFVWLICWPFLTCYTRFKSAYLSTGRNFCDVQTQSSLSTLCIILETVEGVKDFCLPFLLVEREGGWEGWDRVMTW